MYLTLSGSLRTGCSKCPWCSPRRMRSLCKFSVRHDNILAPGPLCLSIDVIKTQNCGRGRTIRWTTYIVPLPTGISTLTIIENALFPSRGYSSTLVILTWRPKCKSRKYTVGQESVLLTANHWIEVKLKQMMLPLVWLIVELEFIQIYFLNYTKM